MTVIGFFLDIVLSINLVLLIWLTILQFLKTIEIQIFGGKNYGRNSVLSVMLLLLSTFFGTACLFILVSPRLNFYVLKILGAV